MQTLKLLASELLVGDVIVTNNGGRYTITDIVPGMGGPYLTLTLSSRRLEHDTSFDRPSHKYTVERSEDYQSPDRE